MSLVHYVLFCGIAVLQVGSPGPATLFLVDNAMARGWKRAMGILSGDLLAVSVLAGLALLGADAVLAAHPGWFVVLKLTGALYLAWLGLRHWAGASQATPTQARGAPHGTDRTLWAKSFLVGISNPKAILFFSSLLPQFVEPARAGTTMSVELVATFVAIKLVVSGAYAALATRMMPRLRDGRHAAWGKRLAGTVFLGFGAAIATSAFR